MNPEGRGDVAHERAMGKPRRATVPSTHERALSHSVRGQERALSAGERPRPVAVPPANADSSVDGSADLPRIIGANLRRLRMKRGLSLERLSKASGVSRAMLGQVELGRSMPTLKVLWKIARAVEVPFSALITDRARTSPTVLRASTANVFTSRDGAFVSRTLFPLDDPRAVEFYELRLAPGSVERALAHPPGTRETLVVAEGRLGMVVGGTRHRLASGDAIVFEADVAHEYWNEGAATLRVYLVMTYGGAR